MNNIWAIIIKTIVLAGSIYHTFICFGSLIRKQTIPGLSIAFMALHIALFVALQFWI